MDDNTLKAENTSKKESGQFENDPRTEEVQTIIERMPVTGSVYVAIVTAVVVLTTILLGFLIKYPDTVDGQITITARYAPVRMVSNANGQLRLLKENNAEVKQHDILSYIDNAALYKDVETVRVLLEGYHADSVRTDRTLPTLLQLGEIGSAYNNFVIAHYQYCRFLQLNTYPTQKNSLRKQIAMDSVILNNIGEEISLRNEILDITGKQSEKDSLMYASKALTEAELLQKKKGRLSEQESYQVLLTNQSSVLSRIHSNVLDLERLSIEEAETENKLFVQLLASKNELANTIDVWKKRYVTYAPLSGKLEYLGFWRENSFVQSGEELFSVMPMKNEIEGEVIIPSVGAGKVEKGLAVNVKLDNFPYDEYGSINGVVKSISHITNNIQTNNGNVNTYRVVVSFPDGSKTNYGNVLNLNFETKGTAEIITHRKQLIHRLFDNLKYSVSK